MNEEELKKELYSLLGRPLVASADIERVKYLAALLGVHIVWKSIPLEPV